MKDIDLTDDEVKQRLGSYLDPAITDELYEFGRMLLQDAVDRIGKVDSKGAAFAAYCGGLITALVATSAIWSKLQDRVVWLIYSAAVCIFVAGAFAMTSMALKRTEWFTQNEWLKVDCLSSADRIRRYHILTTWGVVKSHHAAYRGKILMLYVTQFLLGLAGVILLVALL